jgi:hypothetical protein
MHKNSENGNKDANLRSAVTTYTELAQKLKNQGNDGLSAVYAALAGSARDMLAGTPRAIASRRFKQALAVAQ